MVAGEEFEITEESTAKAMEVWAGVPPEVFAADPPEQRDRTLLKMIEAAVADPTIPEFDQQQAIDELKQYLWAGTETTALTLAWALYETSRDPDLPARPRGGQRGLGWRRPRADGRRLFSARLYARCHPGNDAHLPADLGTDASCRQRRRNRRQTDSSR